MFASDLGPHPTKSSKVWDFRMSEVSMGKMGQTRHSSCSSPVSMSWPPGNSCGAYLHIHYLHKIWMMLSLPGLINTGHAQSMAWTHWASSKDALWDLSGKNMGALYEQQLVLQVLSSLLLSQWAWWTLVPERGEIQRCRKLKNSNLMKYRLFLLPACI